MLDRYLRPLIDPPLNRLAWAVADTGVSANRVTLLGLGVGLGAVVAMGLGHNALALWLLLGNRLLDGLDGAVARLRGPTEFGGYLDIVSDFAIWALLPLSFAVADPSVSFAAALLLASFMATGTTFLAHAILAAKAGTESKVNGPKSFYHLTGLTEGSETILLFVIVLTWPETFVVAAPIFATLAFITALSRALQTWKQFGKQFGR